MNAIELFNNPFIYSEMNIEQKIEFLQQNLDRSITFVGLMGAGKSSIGRMLAKSLNLEFVDSDIVVEGQERRTIADIFKVSGEAYFRELERQSIIDLVSEAESKVIGTGGGAFMNAETREIIKEKTLSVFLQGDCALLVKRVGTGVGRPLFEGKQPEDVLSALIKERYPIYKQADIVVEAKDEPLQETLNRVIETLYSYLAEG